MSRLPLSSQLPDRSTLVLTGVLAVLLLPVVFFPPSGDTTLFFESGQKILHGAAHYRDIVDVKPPLIYYMYAAAAAIFGSHVMSFRLLDFFLQLVTAVMVARVGERYLGRTEGMCAAVIYAVFYIAQSYNGTGHTESYVGLLALPMIALQMRRGGWRTALAIGTFAGALFLLKYSLATPLIAAVLAELVLFDEGRRTRIRNVAVMLAGFAIVAALLPLYLTAFDAWGGFAEMDQFLDGYIAHQSGIVSALREALTAIPAYFADEFSLTLFVLAALGAALALGPRIRRSTLPAAAQLGTDHNAARLRSSDVRVRSEHADLRGDERERVRIIRICTINAVLMVLAVVLEAKFRAFHFSRLIPYASILSAVGLLFVVDRLRRQRPLDTYSRAMLAMIVPVALALSPLARYARHTYGAMMWAVDGARGFDRTYYREVLGYSMVEIDSIARHVRLTRGPSDEMYVSSGVANLVYSAADEIPPTRILHSAFLIAPYAPNAWRTETARYITQRRPRYIVLHLRDSMEEMTGSRVSSANIIRQLPGVDAVLRSDYDTAMTLPHYELYERRGN